MISGIATLVCMLAFIGIVWWAYGSARKERFEEAARLPLDDTPAPSRETSQEDECGGGQS